MHLSPEQAFLDSLRPCAESQELAAFVRLNPADRVIDLGCGNGYMAFAVALRHRELRSVLGVDVNPTRIAEAEEFLQTAAPFVDQHTIIEFMRMDAREPWVDPHAYDHVICNPPFFAHHAGRTPHRRDRHLARMDDVLSFEDVVAFSRHALKPGGKVSVVLPEPRRGDFRRACDDAGACLIHEQKNTTIRKRDGGIVCLEASFENLQR